MFGFMRPSCFPNDSKVYCTYSKYQDRQARANSVDLDQIPQFAASDLGLHDLQCIQQMLRHINKL